MYSDMFGMMLFSTYKDFFYRPLTKNEIDYVLTGQFDNQTIYLKETDLNLISAYNDKIHSMIHIVEKLILIKEKVDQANKPLITSKL